MISCNLNKPESTFDHIRKTYPDLKPTDAALLATALVEAGRMAEAIHDGHSFTWKNEEYDGITKSVAREVAQVQETYDKETAGVKKKAAKNEDNEPVVLSLTLRPSMQAGEGILGSREDLKTLLGDILAEGVEFLYLPPTDMGWNWTLDRVNWTTLSAGEMARFIRFHAVFEDPHVTVELGPGGKKKKAKAVKKAK